MGVRMRGAGRTGCYRAVVLTVGVSAAGFQALSVPAAGQSAPLEIARLSAPITLDGMPNEDVWQSVPSLPLTMYFPRPRQIRRSALNRSAGRRRIPVRMHTLRAQKI